VKQFMKLIQRKARDHARTPMHWDASENSGFSTVKPWMRVTDDYKEWNAENQVHDPDSVFNFWANALKIRKEHKDVLVYGGFETIGDDENVFSFLRESSDGTKKILVVLNFTEKEVEYDVGSLEKESLVMNNYKNLEIVGEKVRLKPFQGFVSTA